MKNNRITFMVGIGLILSTQILLGYEDRGDEPENFRHHNGNIKSHVLKQFDKNNDGKIAFDEAPDKMQEHFAEHDLNDDGFIDGNEFDTLPKHPPKGDRPPID